MQARNFTVIALAAALTAGLATGVAAAAPPTSSTSDDASSAGQAISDTWITAKVKIALTTTEGINSSAGISVKTVDGVVSLIGVLPSQGAVDKAIAAAKSVKGVKDVNASGLKIG